MFFNLAFDGLAFWVSPPCPHSHDLPNLKTKIVNRLWRAAAGTFRDPRPIRIIKAFGHGRLKRFTIM